MKEKKRGRKTLSLLPPEIKQVAVQTTHTLTGVKELQIGRNPTAAIILIIIIVILANLSSALLETF